MRRSLVLLSFTMLMVGMSLKASSAEALSPTSMPVGPAECEQAVVDRLGLFTEEEKADIETETRRIASNLEVGVHVWVIPEPGDEGRAGFNTYVWTWTSDCEPGGAWNRWGKDDLLIVFSADPYAADRHDAVIGRYSGTYFHFPKQERLLEAFSNIHYVTDAEICGIVTCLGPLAAKRRRFVHDIGEMADLSSEDVSHLPSVEDRRSADALATADDQWTVVLLAIFGTVLACIMVIFCTSPIRPPVLAQVTAVIPVPPAPPPPTVTQQIDAVLAQLQNAQKRFKEADAEKQVLIESHAALVRQRLADLGSRDTDEARTEYERIVQELASIDPSMSIEGIERLLTPETVV